MTDGNADVARAHSLFATILESGWAFFRRSFSVSVFLTPKRQGFDDQMLCKR